MLKNTPESDKRAKDLKVLDDAIEQGHITVIKENCEACGGGRDAHYVLDSSGQQVCEECAIFEANWIMAGDKE